ncbi:MAG: hypothetical protein GWM92_07365, partial [Gemmatimonadetes bacterium]|nr:hypothetical protein [Gemmatimonadota bacterium]NIR78445.1 hypothetical protein [Gemmatimonadota bacterium]NIT87055.1 hypothetical protein [Gemmatimonadota bacterium]NIU30894.1 hypothetical protein [Gemmatimonadota bacterium]NIU35657.1 hypothetical protein [Gemmatimonadota bacterium]
ISARVHRAHAAGSAVPLRISAHEDSLGPALERLAVQVVSAVWQREQLPTVPEIDRSATQSAEALKAYLEAKGALRQGRIDAARQAVERAVALDSTFALAHLERFLIQARILSARGRPLTGLRPMIERAARHAGRLTPRNRMRIDAHRALDATDGRRAAFLFERILAIDSLDVDALEGLAFTYLTLGWQIEADAGDVERAHRRVLRADSANTEALATLARLAWWRDELGAAGAWVERLGQEDSLTAHARGTRAAHQILTARESGVDPLLRRWAGEEVGVVTAVLRDLRTVRPGLAEGFLDALSADSMPTYHRRLARGGRAQLWFARGRLAAVDSLLEAGELETLRTPLAVFHVAAALAGVGDREAAARSARALPARTPLDSLEAHLETRDVWRTAWAVGAYHAAFGDTVLARRWRDAVAELPPGETTTVPEWPSALASDLEARLAVRRGDAEAADRWSLRAHERWSVHGSTSLEHHPEPAIRFHRAQVLRDRGATGRARALYRSLCPPHTWMGFYTARSWLELAKLQEAAGETAEAALNYRAAARMWEAGDEVVVGRWLDEARAGVERSTGQ